MTGSSKEDFPEATPPARPLRSMHTGQNSIAPESSLPQVGQVRWVSVLIVLSALQSQLEPKATPRSTEWCEIGQHSTWHSFVRFTSNRVFGNTSALNRVSEQNSCRSCHAASRVGNELRRGGGSKLTVVNRRLSMSPQTVWLVRRLRDFWLFSELLGFIATLVLQFLIPLLTAYKDS